MTEAKTNYSTADAVKAAARRLSDLEARHAEIERHLSTRASGEGAGPVEALEDARRQLSLALADEAMGTGEKGAVTRARKRLEEAQAAQDQGDAVTDGLRARLEQVLAEIEAARGELRAAELTHLAAELEREDARYTDLADRLADSIARITAIRSAITARRGSTVFSPGPGRLPVMGPASRDRAGRGDHWLFDPERDHKAQDAALEALQGELRELRGVDHAQ
ncbi:hypothetical protein [Ectothiorhodospira variabilis]|uniref:hypothetical protein n=1 Tax=Ectothiorhodospira variabilis TaxID=505694 RepID=UPI001EFB0CD3|nr:hypothetical protein [Ectothiorhodospira variabilis]MCG5495637.1 hypothetical protein [Ectothiorhodospira variabilis]MCG5504698.1 hypothetical protein [Ectothiorhodospira variabilis]MCG5507855.1 hypothetical protein [Ectothiorhodospira variabilis]